MKKLALSVVLAMLLAACASTDTKEQAPAAVEDRASTTAQPGTQPGADTKPLAGEGVGADPLKDPGSILSKRSVFFDYDSFLVKDEFKSLVQAHADYLRGHRSAAVILQGNADERGSREYNLALGQKRAESVRRMMELLGVQERQIEAVSFGEEKPRCTESSEPCWGQNRRADMVYRGE